MKPIDFRNNGTEIGHVDGEGILWWGGKRVGLLVELLQTLPTLEERIRAEEREACAEAAGLAALPAHFQWGRDAMEQFDFGKERAAEAIRARGTSPATPPDHDR